MTGPISVAEIAAMLGGRALALCAELLPNGKREGPEWRAGSLAGEPGRSLAVRLTGLRAGVWADFGGSSDDRGDALDLVAAVLFASDKRKAIAWSRAWLGLDAVDPRAMETHRRAAAAKAHDAEREEQRREASAMRLWREARPLESGDPVWRYLGRRLIDLAQFGRPLHSLRFHPALMNSESGRTWPAMVAAIYCTGAKDRLAAVHRTFLEEHDDGRVSKAPLVDPKMTLGRYVGGCIRLWRGASDKPLRQAQPSECVMISEGLEDGLTAALAAPEMRCLVAVSLANMGSMWLPSAIGEVILLAQNDPPGSKAEAALQRAIGHFQATGRHVRIARPPPEVKDLNELAMLGEEQRA